MADELDVLWLTDDTVNCPKCGSRTEWEDTDHLQQRHTCLGCGHVFLGEWDPEEIDEDGNWIDPNP